MAGDILDDLRTSVRQLARTPGFTAAAIAVLALGIGLNAAVFGLFHALAFAGRPFERPDEIVQLYSRHRQEAESYRPFSHGAYEVVRGRHDVFAGVAAHALDLVGVRDAEARTPRRTFAAFVSENYFQVLGVPIVQGRGFTAEEARPGSRAAVAIASNVMWRRLGSPADLVGRTVVVNERPVTVIGLAPPGFTGTMMVFGPELFLPFGLFDDLASGLSTGERRGLSQPEAYEVFLVGRLAPGLGLDSARGRLAPTAAAMAEAFPAQYRDREVTIAPLPRFGTSTNPSDESGVALVAAVFLGLTAAVLLVVCLNLASVVVARGQARRREFAIRLALGGGRFRIVRQLMIEALLLGVAGAIGGVLLGLPAIDAFLSTLLSRLPISLAVEAGTTGGTVAGGLAFGVLAALMFALGPALRHSKADGLAGLKHQLGDEAPTRRRWLRYPLVTTQVALSLALLVAAGLLVRFAREGTAVDVGVSADETLLVDVDAGLAGFDQAGGLAQFRAALDRLQAMPDVDAAAVGVTVPFGSVHLGERVRRAGTNPAPGERPSTPEAGQSFNAGSNAVSGGYFAAMGLPLLRGRTFTDPEALAAGAPRVAVVDEALARKLWPDGDALGQSVHIGRDTTEGEPPVPIQIVGIVGTMNDSLFASEPSGTVFLPLAQQYRGGAYLHVRPRPGAAPDFAGRVRAAVSEAAPALPVYASTAFKAHMESSLEFWGLRALALAATGVGAFAACIALVGVYGAKAYAVSRRAKEIGVRLAVGASPGGVRVMIVREALSMGAVGVAIGSVLGLGIGRVLASVFVDLTGFDAWLSTLAAVLFLAACGAAAWVPAVRASRLDPSAVLRAE
ncbi:MAG: ABC transporter permease [Vicinamibacterales bacterium]